MRNRHGGPDASEERDWFSYRFILEHEFAHTPIRTSHIEESFGEVFLQDRLPHDAVRRGFEAIMGRERPIRSRPRCNLFEMSWSATRQAKLASNKVAATSREEGSP